MNDLKIEKGIPSPSKRGRVASLSTVLKSMALQDSVYVECKNSGSVNAPITKVKKETAFQFTTRKVEGGFRVWRIL